EQDSTDFEKSLARLAAPMIFGVGFLGGRFDHALAAQTVLVRYPHRKCILLGSEDIVFLAPPRLSLDLPLETRLSLFPMAPVKILSEGLYWPTRGLTFQPDGQVGTSNKVSGPLRLQPEKAKMLVILPRLHLAQVAAALDAAPSWPALGT
ncbi:MAG: thiamine pyrophosphokinase, partial [Paracoccaceae bacterium]